MSDRPTPETDVVRFYLKTRTNYDLTDFEIWKNHAEKMERERDEAQNLADKLARQGLDMMDENRSLTRERDEAREKYTTLLTENMFSVHQLCKERDEAIADRDIARLNALESDRAHDRMVGELEGVYKQLDEAQEALRQQK